MIKGYKIRRLKLLLFITFFYTFIHVSIAYIENHPLLSRGKCKSHVWRTDEIATLPGKCHGVNPTSEFDDLKNISINHFADCRALCCNLEERCTTWQFLNTTKTCFIQKRPVRRGQEGADTALYCDPFPTHKWNGKYIESRKPGGICTWAFTIPKQCFAFGNERLNNSGIIHNERDQPGNRMNEAECEQACCNDETCNSWQEYPNRGCFFGQSSCKHEEVEGVYEGSRKCLPGFCGNPSKELEILSQEQILKLNKLVESFKLN